MSSIHERSEGPLPAVKDDGGSMPVFPQNFFWGTATAAYQIEGATREDGRGLSIWDQFAATPGKVHAGDTGDIAINHYHLMADDVALMAKMGLSAYRFSVSWPRILPQGTGQVNSAGLDFYDRLVDTLLAHHITPMITLYHWDLPLALHTQGGWLKRDIAYAFADYAQLVFERLGDRVNHWLTHNEPWCAAFLGYGIGVHAPGIQDKQSAFCAGHNILLSHGLAVQALRTLARPTTQIGIALNLYPVYGIDDTPEIKLAADMLHTFKNRWLADPLFKGCYPERLFRDLQVAGPDIQDGDMDLISAPIDMLGINYYSRNLVQIKGDPEQDGIEAVQEINSIPGSKYTAMNWEVYPQGLTDILSWVHNEYHPRSIMITENGSAYEDNWNGDGYVSDPERTVYLREHIRAMGDALEQGVPITGYFAWSLMDNFEWAEGYSKRFGVVYVDYPTQRRIIKESGRWYMEFIRSQRS